MSVQIDMVWGEMVWYLYNHVFVLQNQHPPPKAGINKELGTATDHICWPLVKYSISVPTCQNAINPIDSKEVSRGE